MMVVNCSKRITLIMPVAKFNAAEAVSIPPYALLYIGTRLKQAGYDVSLYHGNDVQEALRHVTENDVYVGISAFTGHPVKMACEFAKAIKARYPKLPIVLGGYHASMLTEQAMGESYFDFAVVGEGEETAVELAHRLASGEKTYADIQGLAWKRMREGVVMNARRPFPKSIDFEIDWSLVDVKRYVPTVAHLGSKKLLFVFSSRGCPFSCSFCAGSYLYRQRYRKASADFVVAQYRPLVEQYGVDAVEYLDDNFFVDLKWAEQVTRGIGVPYRSLIRIDRVNAEVCDLLLKTRCRALFIGLESGSEDVRMRVMNKRITNDQIYKGLQMLRDRCPQVNVAAMFITGIPGETYAQYRETCTFALELTKIHPRLLPQANVYAPYPYCQSYVDAVQAGWTPPARTEDWTMDSKQGDQLQPVWLSWYSASLKKKLDMTATMFLLLRKAHGLSGFRGVAKRILECCARFRLKYDIFTFPMEMLFFRFLYQRFMRSSIASK